MNGDAVAQVVQAGAYGIPKLYEWGGLVTLLTLIMLVTCAAIIGLCWIIWQMYKQNQEMFNKSIEASNRGAAAIEMHSEFLKGLKAANVQ